MTCLGAIESPESPIWSVQLLAYIPHPEVHLQKKFKKKKKKRSGEGDRSFPDQEIDFNFLKFGFGPRAKTQ